MTENTTRKGSSTLFVLLFLLSLALNVFLFFRYVKRGQLLERQNQGLTMLLDESKITLDSLQRELDFTISQLEERINENLALQDLKDDVRKQLEGKIVELQRARNQISTMLVDVGLTNNAGKALSIVEAKAAITKLRKDNSSYMEQLSTLSNEKNQLAEKAERSQELLDETKNEKDKLNQEKKKMEEKLAVASIIRIGSLNFEAIQDKKSKSEPVTKVSRLDRFKISLNVLPSEVTEEGEKQLDFRVLGTNNEVMSAGNKLLMDSDKLVSTSQKITYDGTKKNVVVYFKPKEEKLKGGTYKVEVFEGEALLGTQQITLR